jgi:serine/threonine protein kinase
VSDPVASSADAELRAHVERVLSAHYELDREIGRGGMGIVYKARDRRLKRPVAIKILPPELAFRSDIRTRFLREAETAAQLSHPNIVPIYSVDEREGLVFFVMAFVDGSNLAVRLHERGPYSPDDTRRILREVADALQYAHERGVVHRDIKPDNILINLEDERVLVTDFGIARAAGEGGDARLTATGMAIGTPAYMSPEQSMGEREVDGRSDLYALGVVAYQMLSGDLPFSATSTPAMLVKHISERPTPIDVKCHDLPEDLGRIVMILLEKEPANRFPTAQALVTALDTGDVPMPASAGAGSNASLSLSMRGYDLREPRRGLTSDGGYSVPSVEEQEGWNNPEVRKFRQKLAPFFVVSGVLVVLAVFGVIDGMFFVGMWSVYLAWKYAKLWTAGHDWHDVFKQPKDRLFFDVVAEWVDNIKGLWDPKKRAEMRERSRVRSRGQPLFFEGASASERALRSARPSSSSSRGPLAPFTARLGAHAKTVRDAQANRDEILNVVATLSKRDREQIADVPETAKALYARIDALANSLSEVDRATPTNHSQALEKEIAQLESEANPLDVAASEDRNRRLVLLKRQRRANVDVQQRRERMSAKLESCALMLQNMRFDLARLKTGGQSFQHITQVTERAMSLAKEVDNAVYVADELSKLKGPPGPDRGAPGR